MDVNAVIFLTGTKVVDTIAYVPFVVHTLMPEKEYVLEKQYARLVSATDC